GACSWAYETAGICSYTTASPWPELHGAAHVGGIRGRPAAPARAGGARRPGAAVRHRLLSRQRPAVTATGGYRGLAVGQNHAAAWLLSAGGLVPVSVWGADPLLYPGSGQALGAVSGLDGDAALPAILQEGDSALACRRAGEVAGDGGQHAFPFAHVPADEASRSEHRAFQIQSRGRREAVLARDPGGEQRHSRPVPAVCGRGSAAAPGTL